MASRRLVAAAAASRLPLARLVSRPGLGGPAGRYWPEKFNLREDPMNPMRWKASRGIRRFSTDFREPADKAVKETAGKAASGMHMWWLRATYPIHSIKHRIRTATLKESAMARFVFILCLGTATVVNTKRIMDIGIRR